MLSQYCHIVDVLRKFNPQLTEASLEGETYIGQQDTQQIEARIRAVGSDFETNTGRALRLQRAGSPGAEETYAVGRLYKRRPLKISFPHDHILPFDPSEGDSLEFRVARDRYRDITEDTNAYVLKSKPGQLTIYRRRLPNPFWGDEEDRIVRATYRYGALGGDNRQGGQTALTEAVDDETTTLSVENTGRLPTYPDVVLINNSEYAQVVAIDHASDELTVRRGSDATVASEHDSGVPVHYCPRTVRDAVAGKVAQELLRYDDWVEELAEEAQMLGGKEKVDQWEKEYEQQLGKHAGVRRM